ncbi:hypothetical protein ACWDRB_65325 [Nonomuraea sp. NPDC003707]
MLLVLCGVSQYGMHQLFAADESAVPAPLMGASGGHEHGSAPGMLLIHVAVALGSSWWLARGEMALAAILGLGAVRMSGLWRLLVAALAVPARVPVMANPGIAPIWPEAARRVPALLTRALSRRGPPEPRPCA